MSTSPPTLAITFENNSNLNASDVYIGFFTNSTSIPLTIVNASDNSPILMIDDVDSYPAQGNWYTLDALSSGVIVTTFSGRVYVCYGTPWATQNSSYEPAQAVTDPNLYLRYDKMEMTFQGVPSDVANLTSIDYWSIPMSLNTFQDGMLVGTVSGLLTDVSPPVTTQDVFNALNPLTTPPVSGVPGPGGTDGTPMPALVPGQYQQFGKGPTPGTTFARIIGPSSYPPAFPPPGGIPVMPYDLLQDYLTYLLNTYGPSTSGGGSPPTLGAGVIAFISGEFPGVGPNVPPTGPLSQQSYDLTATIDADLNITLTGTTSSMGDTVMVYEKDDLLNPTGIYGGNAPFYLNGSTTLTTPANDVYGWIGGDLFSGLNIGAVGSATVVGGQVVGDMPSQSWFQLPVSSFFSNLQPDGPYYNQWAATLSTLSQAYNFAYTDRFAYVFVSLDSANVDTLQIVLEAAAVDMSQPSSSSGSAPK